jgi:3D (Asp-Asp-Asp) domain-containing protein
LRVEQVKNPSAGIAALAALLIAAMAGLQILGSGVSGHVRPPDAAARSVQETAVDPAVAPHGDPFPSLDFVPAVATGYSSAHDETDASPWITATETHTRPGVIALSRDLLQTFTEDAPFDYGDVVLVAGVGVFRVEDTMNARWTGRADIWFPTKAKARRWGRRKVLVARIDPECDGHPVADESHLDAILAAR